MDLQTIASDLNPWWTDPRARPPEADMARRDMFAQVLDRARGPSGSRAVVVLGPRQVGKTTLLAQIAAEALTSGFPAPNVTYFDFWDDRLTGALSPRAVVDIRPVGLQADQPRLFLLDELHRAERWDRWLKQAVDSQRRRMPEIRYLVTGSAAALLGSGSRESGLGRWDELVIEGLTFAEFLRLGPGGAANPAEALARHPQAFDRYLLLGGFPAHMFAPDAEETRRTIRSDIADRAIHRDLYDRGVDLSRVKALFIFLTANSGAIWNALNRGRDLEADRRVVQSWLDLLEETRLVVPLPKYVKPGHGNAGKQLRPHPKLYAADHGLVLAFASMPKPFDDPHVRACVFETTVYRHLRHVRAAVGAERISYFRTGDESSEIDFVLDLPSGQVGIEVTTARDVRRDKVEKLRAAGERLGSHRLLLVHGGVAKVEGAGVPNVPLHEFLLDPVRWIIDSP